MQEETEKVTESCTWCGDDISRSRHDKYKTNCRICGGHWAKNDAWVQKQRDKRARKMLGLPDEDIAPKVSTEEIALALTGEQIRRIKT